MSRAALLPALLLTGCASSPVVFSDSIDLHLNFGLLSDKDAGLHEPYVRGADFSFTVQHRRDNDMTGWQVLSLDADLFSLECGHYDEEALDIGCTAAAVGDGFTEVVVLDDSGEEVGQTTIEVALPDRIELLPHGPLIIDRADLIDDTFQVLEGGTSTWLARYYLGDQRLHGNGALSVQGGEGFDAWTEDSFLFEDRDWLQGTAHSPGEHNIALLVDGEFIADAQLTAVDAPSIDRIELHGMDEAGAEEEDHLVVLAQAYDVQDRPVYGVEYDWDLDGVGELGEGDLYRYTYDPDSNNTVTASFDGLGAEVTIHGEGYVDSTNNVGCSVVGGVSGGLAGLLVGLLGIARRRR